MQPLFFLLLLPAEVDAAPTTDPLRTPLAANTWWAASVNSSCTLRPSFEDISIYLIHPISLASASALPH